MFLSLWNSSNTTALRTRVSPPVYFLSDDTGYYGARKLPKKFKFRDFLCQLSRVRSLWEQKVAQKVWKLSDPAKKSRFGQKVCKLSALRNLRKKVSRRDSSQSTSRLTTNHTHTRTHVERRTYTEVDKIGDCGLSSSRIAPTKGFEQP